MMLYDWQRGKIPYFVGPELDDGEEINKKETFDQFAKSEAARVSRAAKAAVGKDKFAAIAATIAGVEVALQPKVSEEAEGVESGDEDGSEGEGEE